MDEAVKLGSQGLELCVFRKDTDRADHIATHLDYKDFTPDKAKHVVDVCNEKGVRVSSALKAQAAISPLPDLVEMLPSCGCCPKMVFAIISSTQERA